MSTLTTARSPRAFLLAVLLHALLAGSILVFGWWTHRNRPEPAQIFELVAGEGNDYKATEAPTAAVEVPTVKLELPEPPPPPVVTRAPTPEPQPAPPPKIERVPEPAPPPKRETPPPAPKVQKAPKIEKAPDPPQPRTTFNQFVKEHGAPKTQAPPKAPPKISPKTIDLDSLARRVPSTAANTVASGAGGTALTRPEMDLWEAYSALIIQRIRRSMENSGMTDLRSARVEFQVSAAGSISGARIIESSGSSEFDAAVLAAFRSIRPLGPPPTGRAQMLRVMIEMRERG